MNSESAVATFAEEIKTQYLSGYAQEHAYRPALKQLMECFEDNKAVNDPKASEHGRPDMLFYKGSNKNIILGRSETKDITINLNKILNSEQLRRYAGYEKLFLTNGLDFKFFQNGEQYAELTIGKLVNHTIAFDSSQFTRLYNELKAFLELPPENIRSGQKLSIIMGGKARRIRDNVEAYLSDKQNSSQELQKIYNMMRLLLVHDLTLQKFADMYAQTLVYGLFVARYNDASPESFSRKEARDLVPASNPFLMEFFDHIVGPRFETRLAHIVDELCEVFSVSSVPTLVEKHLRLFEIKDEKDPIIHFYEDFLKEYDPAERKKMGAYYTPVPVVRFIVNQIDQKLKEEFGIQRGLADSEMINKKIDVGQNVTIRNKVTGKIERTHLVDREFHRVQILDPAVGTATFLNETIKFIHRSFNGQEGRWVSYVEEDLLPRLHGFELMMAPYTIAHLKLGMTLKETGVKEIQQRLGVYLTNTLDEGIQNQKDLFSFGLAEVISLEAAQAATIKHEKPIMVIMGNPPYNNSSNNRSAYILDLIKDYKIGLNERKINLNDDYIKFIRFAQEMIKKNGEGIVGMITNNSFLSGVTHRQMRKNLLETYDKILVVDLHGDIRNKEAGPDGRPEENVFAIRQGVSITICIKNSNKSKRLAEVWHQDIYGKKTEKFELLDRSPNFKKLIPAAPYYFLVPKDFSLIDEYEKGIKLTDLFIKYSAGVKTKVDHIAVSIDKTNLAERVTDIYSNRLSKEEIKSKYGLADNTTWEYTPKPTMQFDHARIVQYDYRPFDTRYTYYDGDFLSRNRSEVMDNHFQHENIGLETSRNGDYIFVGKNISDEHFISGNSFRFPLIIHHADGSKTANFRREAIKQLAINLNAVPDAEDLLDYIYACLWSPSYRQRYREFLKIDFPRVPIPIDYDCFIDLVGIGKKLRKLHLMESEEATATEITYPEPGSNQVDFIKHQNDQVWINQTQYFGNVPRYAWEAYIGLNQPAQSWLKYRKGNTLSSADIVHYQKIIKVLMETDKIMKEIDKTWQP